MLAGTCSSEFALHRTPVPGFRGYYLFDGGPDAVVSIRLFDSADEALASNEVAENWIRNHVLEFTRGMPDVMAGEVFIAELAREPPREPEAEPEP
jgi:hypothetical protein